ncbi:MAG: tRNA (adenosine(37)-N6)-threonylcarbamoyltransferase complex transferase subunit TsaD [Gemmatimonadetes bacterium]|nr:tRNA (adenosine(37)-N6)-threonylcarbamoyltransferase complex transferase subunit TsaD [Gemmatimonadota bacterium]
MADVVLGIETSCDETSAAVLVNERRGPELASLVILSQDVHRVFGGVVPELASRAHLKTLEPVIRRALEEAGLPLSAVDAVAVTAGPGLVGALLVGVCYGKALAAAGGRRLIGVHHLEGHLFAPTLEDPELAPPLVALIVSGGHTVLLDVPAWGRYRLLGQTRDDAAGEAFDKVASMLGLGFPGGPAIERLAQTGRDRFGFPRPMLGEGFDFSFSGLKTAVFRAVRGAYRTALLGGGVACNRTLAQRVARELAGRARVAVASPRLNADNAAMIARAGWFHLSRGETSDHYLDANPRLPWPGLEGGGSAAPAASPAAPAPK